MGERRKTTKDDKNPRPWTDLGGGDGHQLNKAPLAKIVLSPDWSFLFEDSTQNTVKVREGFQISRRREKEVARNRTQKELPPKSRVHEALE